MNNRSMLSEVIEEVGTEFQGSEGIPELSPAFFINLHQLQVKFTRLRYNHGLKSSQLQLFTIMQQLLVKYTDCIDYFFSFCQGVSTYYQAKLKDISKYYQLFRTATVNDNQSSKAISSNSNDKHQIQTIQDLGRLHLKHEPEQKDKGVDTKEIFNQSIMVCLQHQNINVHLKENMKKKEKVEIQITQSLQNQADEIQRRIKNRKVKIHKKRVSQSFSDQITFQADLRRKQKPQEIQEELSNFDIQALEAASPQELKMLIQSKSSQVIENEKEYF